MLHNLFNGKFSKNFRDKRNFVTNINICRFLVSTRKRLKCPRAPELHNLGCGAYWNSDGSVNWHRDYEYDENGNMTRQIFRWIGEQSYLDYEYDENGKEIRMSNRNLDGSVDYYIDRADYEYDENGKITREIWRNADGSVKLYVDYQRDEDGSLTRENYRNPDGSLQYYIDYSDHTVRNPDGTIREEE